MRQLTAGPAAPRPGPRAASSLSLARSCLAARARYRTYSLGMVQRLGIAAALLPGPELLILDEPANGPGPVGIAEMRFLIRSFARDRRRARSRSGTGSKFMRASRP
jgi:ABC-2 type transport system ATP-binding protein